MYLGFRLNEKRLTITIHYNNASRTREVKDNSIQTYNQREITYFNLINRPIIMN